MTTSSFHRISRGVLLLLAFGFCTTAAWLAFGDRSAVTERTFYLQEVVGHSMDASRIGGMASVVVYPDRTPCEGDIVVWRCQAAKCKGGAADDLFVKHLRHRKGDCFWFEGEVPDVTTADGARWSSWDSRHFGWLCGTDVTILGVVGE